MSRKYRPLSSTDSIPIQWETTSRVIDVSVDQWAQGLRFSSGSARSADLQPAEATAEKK